MVAMISREGMIENLCLLETFSAFNLSSLSSSTATGKPVKATVGLITWAIATTSCQAFGQIVPVLDRAVKMQLLNFAGFGA